MCIIIEDVQNLSAIVLSPYIPGANKNAPNVAYINKSNNPNMEGELNVLNYGDDSIVTELSKITI